MRNGIAPGRLTLRAAPKGSAYEMTRVDTPVNLPIPNFRDKLDPLGINPSSQYADDRNLRARQRLWETQNPRFDIVGWTIALAQVESGVRVLDVGCGNGAYLRALRDRGIDAIGVDRSFGMLASARHHPMLVNADIASLPWARDAFDVVLAPHMLYHVSDRPAAAREVRRVLRTGGAAVFVTNGASHIKAIRDLVETAVRLRNPTWEMRSSSTHEFSLDNGRAQLAGAFDSVECVRPEGVAPVLIRDASVVADYVASVAAHYATEIDRPWTEVVAAVHDSVAASIARDGHFEVTGEVGAFVCR